MKKSSIFKWVGLAIVVVLAILVYRLLGGVIGAKVEQQVAKIGLTANEIAANGPLPGDVSLYAKELACQQKIPTQGYYSSLNGAEISDAQRSGVFACATFTGSFDGPNQVYAWRSADGYQATEYITNRRPGEIFVAGRPTLGLDGNVGFGELGRGRVTGPPKQVGGPGLRSAAGGTGKAADTMRHAANGAHRQQRQRESKRGHRRTA